VIEMFASVFATAKSEGIILTARELFVLVALVVVFVWIGWQVLKASRH
jgi:hypothetical protein